MTKKTFKRPQVKREQPRKDSKARRVNFDNERVSKFEKDERKWNDAKADTNKCNDVRWYAANEELLRSAASLPFSPVPGFKIPTSTQQSLPGIMTLTWNPAITNGANAPLNQAANSMYSFTVHANSRNQSYDAVDEMLLVLAGAQVFSSLALGIRAYGLMRRYSQQDYYTPRALLQASGFDPDDLRQNYSQMWFDLNEMIARTQQIWIPNTMPVIERWFWMNSNVYRDGDSVKAQYYMFVPAVFYKYDETTESTGGSLQPLSWYSPNLSAASTPHTWSDYKGLVNQLIDALINSQDRGIIFGDILKAYGADKLYAIKDLPVDYTLEPVYDREVLTQIENATVWPYLYSTSTGVGPIIQSANTDYLVQKWSQATLSAGPTINYDAPEIQVLNFHQKEVPTPAQIMVATRLKCAGAIVYNKNTASTWNYGPETAGTEVVVNVAVWNYLWNVSASTAELKVTTLDTQVTSTSIFPMFLWSAFDWCPWIYQYNGNNLPTTIAVGTKIHANWYDMLGDWDNYTFITTEELTKMNITAVYSEFGVPVLM